MLGVKFAQVVLYTSIMHDGHSPAWENGSVTAAHPDLVQRDERGVCPTAYAPHPRRLPRIAPMCALTRADARMQLRPMQPVAKRRRPVHAGAYLRRGAGAPRGGALPRVRASCAERHQWARRGLGAAASA